MLCMRNLSTTKKIFYSFDHIFQSTASIVYILTNIVHPMNKHVRVTLAPKRLKHSFQSKAIRFLNSSAVFRPFLYRLCLRSTLSSHRKILVHYLLQIHQRLNLLNSTEPFYRRKHIIKINKNDSKRSLLNSLYCINVIERSTKQTFP